MTAASTYGVDLGEQMTVILVDRDAISAVRYTSRWMAQAWPPAVVPQAWKRERGRTKPGEKISLTGNTIYLFR
jgi:hypothetical protein